jgi:hypothetical protein
VGFRGFIAESFDRILLKWLPESDEKIDENRPAYIEYGRMLKIYLPLV